MKARPILFQGDMVRAILDGRKTQTRRVVKLDERGKIRPPNMPLQWSLHPNDQSAVRACPYGQPGDLLWVRESFTYVGTCDPGWLTYRATYPDDLPPDVENVPESLSGTGYRWRPSIHMPRKLSRLTLQVAGVRVERLQEISECDAVAEGIQQSEDFPDRFLTPAGDYATPTVAFQRLWQSINGPDSWSANPWVWVVEFEPIRANVDTVLKEAA